MASVKSRVFRRLSHSNVFIIKPKFRLNLCQKHHITISNLNYKSQCISNTPLMTHSLYAFNTKTATLKKDDELEDDTDSDLSDFSDFTDSDDSDVDEIENKTKQTPQTNKDETPKTNKDGTSKWTFDHGDINQDLLMKDRLIVSNLNFSTNRNDLWELCENYGTVIDVHLPSNKNRDFHNRGFGFITFETDKDAQSALDNVAGTMFNSRQLRAGFARKDTDRSSGPREQITHDFTPSPKKSDRTDFKFASNPKKSETETVFPRDNQIKNVTDALSETAISINGLPGNINLAQITRMFGEFGDIVNISLSPYRMFGHSFMNAVVSIKVKGGSVSNKEEKREIDIKDRSVDKTEMKTRRTNDDRNENKKIGGVDPDTLAKEIDELLADSDDDDDGDNDNDTESGSDSDLSSDEDDDEDETK